MSTTQGTLPIGGTPTKAPATKAAKASNRRKPATAKAQPAAKVTAAAKAVIGNAAREIPVDRTPNGGELYDIRTALITASRDAASDVAGYRFTIYARRVPGVLLIEVLPVPETKGTAERVWGKVEAVVRGTLPEAGNTRPVRARRR